MRLANSRIRTATLVFAILFVVIIASSADAGGRGFFRFRRHTVRHSHPVYRYHHHHHRHSTYYYPRYTGGFHASYFNSLGVPSGDVGLRGNGFYMTPW